MTKYALFNDDGKMAGYGIVSKESERKLIETTKEELASVFEEAPVDELDNIGGPIEAAIDDPIAYRDFLLLKDGEIVFDETYAREVEE